MSQEIHISNNISYTIQRTRGAVSASDHQKELMTRTRKEMWEIVLRKMSITIIASISSP